MPTERVLADFVGTWDIARQVIPASGPPATFRGQGVWTPVPGGCDYRETGVLQLAQAAPMTAERRYFWESDLSVRFEDGRFFHRVPPLGGEATHFCDPDTYAVRYDFGGWPVFGVMYRVHGPRKDYRMVSAFTRAPAS